jgi:hypothetical protein
VGQARHPSDPLPPRQSSILENGLLLKHMLGKMMVNVHAWHHYFWVCEFALHCNRVIAVDKSTTPDM